METKLAQGHTLGSLQGVPWESGHKNMTINPLVEYLAVQQGAIV